jgi:hypothetical protein
MSARRELGSPPSRKDRTAFREVFLLYAPPAGAGALRQFGRYMYDTLVESAVQEAPEPRVQPTVLALAEDLRFSAQVLAGLGGGRETPGLNAEERALAMKAESWAREVLELVRAIEGAAAATGGVE